MKTYYLGAAVTVSAFTHVEAESLEEAICIAEDRYVVLGGPCSFADPTESWIIQDADGLPQDIHE